MYKVTLTNGDICFIEADRSVIKIMQYIINDGFASDLFFHKFKEVTKESIKDSIERADKRVVPLHMIAHISQERILI